MAVGSILEVAVPAPLMGTFDYLAPRDNPALCPGQRLKVPFGRGVRVGVLVAIKETSTLSPGRLKRALAVLDEAPLLPVELLRLLRFAAHYYQHPPGEVCAAALPKALREGGPPAQGEALYTLTTAGSALEPAALNRAPLQSKVLDLLRRHGAPLGAAAFDELGTGWPRAVRALKDRGLVEHRRAPLVPDGPEVAPDQPPELTADQASAVQRIGEARGFACFLLDGVTGSGKTEVYLRCIGEALAAGRQSLLLVPEIGLTPQLQERVARRFRVPVAALHSGLSDGDRLRAWCGARDGSCGIVIGTRSAIFTPLARPGLLIVDEEHDASYKQQDGFRYAARDLAVWRARELDIPLVLGSATPSLESLENARNGRYTRLVLRDRAGQARPPAVRVVDLRSHVAVDGLAAPLRAAIRRHLDAGGQALIYLNRRGFAPTLLCSGCGGVIECARCDARMVLHQAARVVTCHHCGSERSAPALCAACGTPLVPVGLGTERLEQALAAAFPGEAIERIDRDTTRRRGEMERKLGRVRRVEARLLMGTQMLTKGHDFPRVTLVGVVDADQGLFGTDFRSAERLAQCFVQVAGRAGRADRPGEVYLQTLFPDHPLLRVLLEKGYGAFAELALAERRRAGWPPFSALALLRVEAHRQSAVTGFLEAAARLARDQATGAIQVLGPAPAPMERRSGRFRGQLLIRSAQRQALQRFLPGWRTALGTLPAQKHVRMSLDVDPVDLF